MFRVFGIFVVCLIGGTGCALAATNTPTSPSGAFSYVCDENTGTCSCEMDRDANDCRNMLDSGQCSAPENVGTPWTSESDARGNGFSWTDYVSCDLATGRCTCNLATREVPGIRDRHSAAHTQVLEVFERSVTSVEDEGLGENAVAGNDTNSRNATAERRRRSGLGDINDGTSNTRIVTEMAMMNSGEEEEEEMPMVSLHSEEAPRDPIVRDHRTGPVVRDHRASSDPVVRDHRGEPAHAVERDPNEEVENHVVPARRGGPRGNRPETATDPSENAPLPVGLNAPSNLDTSDVAARTVMLHWMDNSTREWGVELYRMDPVAARRTGVINWEFIGNFEERRDSNVTGTGMRSDQDFDLTPETNYCYRLRAYVGFDKSELSDFSGNTCVFTTP